MKKFLVLLAGLWLTIAARAGDPSAPVMTAFQKTFHPIKSARWYESGEGYVAYFEQDGIRYRVSYDSRGNISSSLRYYLERDLPFYIAVKLKNAFPGKQVFGVTEVFTGDALFYRVTLEDSKGWTIVKAEVTGDCFVETKMKKQEATSLAKISKPE